MKVAIAGAGGMGREALAWLRDARPDVEPVAFYTADASERPTGVGVDLRMLDTLGDLLDAGVAAAVLGIGDPMRRREVSAELAQAGLGLLSVVHPSAFLGPGVLLEDGVLVAPGCVLTRDIRLGRGAIINYGAAIGHDCTIGEFAFVGPGAILTGDVKVGVDSLIGAGAVVLPGLSVGRRARVGAGAVVTEDISASSTVVGSPAGPLADRAIPSD
jgi:sugar O-acyltransferase (sialic acid O-acetyltransferase NeuD family)